MSRALHHRVARLEALRNLAHQEKGTVVIEGVAEGGDGGQIDALIRHGDARPHDVFVVINRFGAATPRYHNWEPYRIVSGERRILPMEYLQ